MLNASRKTEMMPRCAARVCSRVPRSHVQLGIDAARQGYSASFRALAMDSSTEFANATNGSLVRCA